MKYLLIEIGKEKYWFELDNDGHANRQIVLDEHNQIHISCLEDCLAEGSINEKDVEGNISKLSKQEFDNLWRGYLKKYKKTWEEVKKSYPIGVYVRGKFSYSYPQGSIIKGSNFIAIYKGEESFCLNQSVQYRVKSYDNMNMWLIVE